MSHGRSFQRTFRVALCLSVSLFAKFGIFCCCPIDSVIAIILALPRLALLPPPFFFLLEQDTLASADCSYLPSLLPLSLNQGCQNSLLTS